MIYILIPVFKRLEQTRLLIDSCEKYISNEKEFIITDDSPEIEHVKFYATQENVTVLKGDGNLWWGGSVNLAIKFLENDKNPKLSDHIIIANNDVIIDESTWAKIIDKLIQNSNYIYSPRVFNLNKNEIKSGGNLKSWIPIRVNYALDFKQDIKEVNLITGRFLCLEYATLKRVGGISPNLPHYNGDWDFALKARNLGVKTFMVKDSSCYVDERSSGNKYEDGMSFSNFYNGLFYDIKSPQNLFFKYQFFRNHNGIVVSVIGLCAEFLKTIIKYLQYRPKRNI